MKVAWSGMAAAMLAASAVGASPERGEHEVPPPVNDLPEHATVIDDLPFEDTVDARGATGGPDERPECPTTSTQPTIWYRYAAEEDHVLEVTAKQLGGVDVFEVGSCEGIETDGYSFEIPARRGTEYLVRVTSREMVTFAARRFVPIASHLEVDMVLRGVGDQVVVTGTLVCDVPGEVRFDAVVFQPIDGLGLDLSFSAQHPGLSLSCIERVPVELTLRRDSRSGSFLPGPARVLWDTYTCVEDDFRFEGWSDCRATSGDKDILLIP